jgi:hypothetical protein
MVSANEKRPRKGAAMNELLERFLGNLIGVLDYAEARKWKSVFTDGRLNETLGKAIGFTAEDEELIRELYREAAARVSQPVAPPPPALKLLNEWDLVSLKLIAEHLRDEDDCDCLVHVQARSAEPVAPGASARQYLINFLKELESTIPPYIHHSITFAQYGSDQSGWEDRLQLTLNTKTCHQALFLEQSDFGKPVHQLIAEILRISGPTIDERRAAPAGTQPPQHPFEVRIIIGGDDWDYVETRSAEIAQYLKERGPDHSQMCSGGGGGSHSITVTKRNISAEEFRKELAEWHENLKRGASAGPAKEGA